MHDIALYPDDRSTILRSEIIGLVKGYVPYVGYLSLARAEVPAAMKGAAARALSLLRIHLVE